ncbi:MAG: cytochrome c biogenesis protein ResB [Verrucomicrobia bacterium]|nr:cytochrome c biogenesis protein ResB [Verrucomicrobiota bacterium]
MTPDSTGLQRPTVAGRIFAFLSSFGLAIVVLFLLLVLTLLGTLEQAEFGLYVVQQKYFNSLYLVHWLFDVVPIPLPGVYLLLVILFINQVCGGMIRLIQRRGPIGVLVAHAGILLLLVSGFVTFHQSNHGSMRLYEGETANEVESYTDWVVEIRRLEPTPSDRIWIIPTKDLEAMGPFGARTFAAADLPFALALAQYQVNCVPVPGGAPPALPPVDGVSLLPQARAKEVEANAAGVYVEVVDKAGGAPQRSIVWAYERHPFAFTTGTERWAVAMKRRTWSIPFDVRLDRFTVELHPNTQIPKVFRSDVTKSEGESHEAVNISMNAPLRYRGYTLFQASWGPQNAPPGTPLFSGFAVVHNPADHWPLYACIIVSAGLLLHFFQKLFFYVKRGVR